MDIEQNFFVATYVDNVKIHPKQINKNIKKELLNSLRKRKEGLCSDHGYIKKNSIEILEYNSGTLELSSFHGYVNYLVKYTAHVCNPIRGNIVCAKVIHINNFGILCNSFLKGDEKTPILEIIVPKHSLSIKSDVDISDGIQRDDIVHVEIVGKKYQLYNKKISIIGRIVNEREVHVCRELEHDQIDINDFDIDGEEVEEVEDDEDEDEDEFDEQALIVNETEHEEIKDDDDDIDIDIEFSEAEEDVEDNSSEYDSN